MKKILIIAGPSAVGKTTLANQILAVSSDFEYARSATTRSKRGDEHDSEYVYFSVDDFIKIAKTGGMLEYTEYEGNLYGTPKSEIEAICERGHIPLLVLDLDGVDSIKSAGEYDSFAVYLYEDLNTLEERLYVRYIGTSPGAKGLTHFCRRKERNIKEFAEIDEISKGFDFIIRNSEIEKTAMKIINAYNSSEGYDNSDAVSEIKSLIESKFKGQ